MTALFLLLVAAAGHAAIWAGAVNRTHASGWPHALVKRLDKLEFLLLFVPPPLVAMWLLWISPKALMPWHVLALRGSGWPAMLAFSLYLVVCWVVAAIIVAAHVVRIVRYDVSTVLRFDRRRTLGTREVRRSPDCPHHSLVHLPGNQALALDLTERGLDVPRLPPELDGLSIVHLTDLHYTGHIARPFFEEMARMSNDLDPDIVAVTGDLIDKDSCMDWLPDTLGRLRARHGIYFIFGNHDLRVDWRRMLRVLDECGLVYLGGRWLTLEIRGQRLLLAGNELPWFKPAADIASFPPRSEVPLRVILAHSPDQLQWGRRADADLMLAGHTHGGQIRLPFIGPVLSPSLKGVQYASGLFYEPPTILSVSRGVSGEVPLRLNCPPEIIHLTLHAASRSLLPETAGTPASNTANG